MRQKQVIPVTHVMLADMTGEIVPFYLSFVGLPIEKVSQSVVEAALVRRGLTEFKPVGLRKWR